MAISAKLVAELRQRTGLPMMKCKTALVEADGDIEAATDTLRKQGVKAAEKVAHRELKEGLVFVHSGDDGGACAVSVLCQTDFVAKSQDVVDFGAELAKDLYDHAPNDEGTGESLASYTLQSGRSLTDIQQEFALKLRENIQVGTYARFRPADGVVVSYVHHNGRIASLVDMSGENLPPVQELGKDLGMQIAFHKEARALTRDDLDPEWIAKEREIFVAQSQDLPEGKRDQIIEGRLSKRLRDVVLLQQPFIKNDKETVEKRVAAVGKEAGSEITVRRFARIAAGA